MNLSRRDPPREFKVGAAGLTLFHCADVELEANEMVTFVSGQGQEYDVVRKTWGYYATPSIEGRLRTNGFRAALVQNARTIHRFVMLVDMVRVNEWLEYLAFEGLQLLFWLDADSDGNIDQHCDAQL
jgi:hypothetical protein